MELANFDFHIVSNRFDEYYPSRKSMISIGLHQFNIADITTLIKTQNLLDKLKNLNNNGYHTS